MSFYGQIMRQGYTVWFTGMSGAGKTTSSRLLGQRLRACGNKVEVLDGDEIRQGLSLGLGFSKDDRDEHVRRIGVLCEMLCRNDVIAIVAAISPYREAREKVKQHLGNFIEVFMDCPLEILVQNDVKGLYKRALAREIPNFPGISDPYEPPTSADVIIRSYCDTVEEGVAKIWNKLKQLELIS